MRESVWGPVDSDIPYSSYRGMSKSRKNSKTDRAMGAAAEPCKETKATFHKDRKETKGGAS
jgi:hypothetical protein